MPGLSQAQAPHHGKLRDPMGRDEEPRLHNPRDMGFLHSFIARVREAVVAGNPSNEFEKIVALKQSSIAAYIVMRRTPRANLEGDPKKSGATLCQYPVRSCVKITNWSSVEKEGTMAVHFKKRDIESKEVRNARQTGKIVGSRRPPKTGRTKVTIISFRRWSVEHAMAVKEIWAMLNDAAEKNQQATDAERPKVFSDCINLPGSVVDQKTRIKERRRFSEDHRMLPNVPRSSFARLSQGQKMMKAMSTGPQQRGGRYSALGRGATGDRSFSQSLIGSPNLKNFDKKPVNLRRESKIGNYCIEEELSDCNHMQTGKEASVAVELIDVGGSLTPAQPVRKRRREATCAEVTAKRKMYLDEQLKRHKASAHTANPRRMLRSSMQSLSGPRSPYSGTVTGSGIVNEGNTCYLSAVVQALMCDGDLIARVGKRIEPGSASMPFSSALSNMAMSRESFKTLKAGQIRHAISKYFPQFSSSDQQDAHEFFLRCLDVIAKECTLSNFRDSPTHTNYSLVQERKFTCTSCGHQTKPRREILRGLSLDIPQQPKLSYDGEQSPLSVEDLIRNFFSSQDLVLDCESCGGKYAKSDTHVVLTPRSLVLHIKRFGVDYLSENGAVSIKKISDRISIPERISLDSVLAQNACSSDIMESAAKMDVFDAECPRNVTPTGIDGIGKLFSAPSSPPTATSLPPLKSQVFNQLSHLLSPADAQATKPSRATKVPFNFARRFRVHADEPKDTRHTDDHDRAVLERSRPNCRNNQVRDEEIEEDNNVASQPSNKLGRGPESKEHARAIMGLGIPKRQAEEILQEANHDLTRAMGLAMDRRQELRENPKDLNEDLMQYISRFEKGRVFGADFGAKPAGYKLAAVIRHHSDTTDRGHYVADVLQQDGSWFCYNDSSVFNMSSTELQDREGYLCWYIAAS